MRKIEITKLGHACVLIVVDGQRILVDPGTYSAGFEALEDLTAVLVTHGHPDHVDVERLVPLLARNPGSALVSDEETAAKLADAGLRPAVARSGDTLDLGVEVAVHGGRHTQVHPDIPTVANVAFQIGGRFLHPGDSLVVPDEPVDVLALPVGGPWLKLGEAIDYLRAVAPRVAVAVHESVLTRPEYHYRFLRELAPEGSNVVVLEDGVPAEL